MSDPTPEAVADAILRAAGSETARRKPGPKAIAAADAAITAARAEGARRALEAAAAACEAQEEAFLDPSYAQGQPISSLSERYACRQVLAAIRAIDPDAIAQEPDNE